MNPGYYFCATGAMELLLKVDTFGGVAQGLHLGGARAEARDRRPFVTDTKARLFL